MKLLRRDAETLTFVLERPERELLTFLLRRYPVLDPAYHQLAAPADRDAWADAQRLLTETMTAEQQENRRRAEEFIRTRLTAPPTPAAPAPAPAPTPTPTPTPTPAGEAEATEKNLDPPSAAPFLWRISLAEADWLLRVVNDVRVGCWV